MESRIVYVSSCVPDGGISRLELSRDGRLTLKDTYPADRPMFAVRRDGMLYMLLRAPFPGKAESGAAALRIHEDGTLSAAGGLQTLGGEVACHLALSPSGKYLYTANYISGSVSQLPVSSGGGLEALNLLIRHAGASVDPKRQTGPHAHCTVFTPDGMHLCVVDLGLDKILLYSVDAVKGAAPAPYSACAMDPGVGPRHIAFSKDGTLAFCANELRSSVTVLRYLDGRLEPIATHPTLPSSFSGDSFCAAVRVSPAGRHLYVSNRGHDSIACFAIEGERLRLIELVDCGGKWPRDFDLTPDGSLLVSANERSNDLSTFRVDRDTGRLVPTGFQLALAAPLSVTFR
jgi:6-phosphogluconolactonase